MISRATLLLLLAFGGCGSESVRELPPAAEPPTSPPLTARPAGTVLAIGRQPEGVVVDPRTGVVAVGLRGPARLALLGRSGRGLRYVGLAGAPRHLALAGPGGPIVVPEESVRSVQAVSPVTGRILTTVAVGRGPHDAAALGTTWFVGNEFADSLSVIRRRSLVARVGVGAQPGGVANAGRDRVAVVAVRQRVLELYSSSTLRRAARVAAGVGPTHLQCLDDRAGGYCFVADTAGDALLIFSLSPRPELLRRIYLPGGPYGIALDPDQRRLWVTLPALNQVVELSADGWRTTVQQRLPVVRQAYSLAVDSVTGRVFVAGRQDGVLEMVDPG